MLRALLPLLLATAMPLPAQTPPPPAAAPAPAFDGRRAHALIVRQVGFGPRVPGTPGHRRQLAWMHHYLATRADTVLLHAFGWTTRDGERLRLTNLLARFRPAAAERVLLVAHWDTRPRADEAAHPADRLRPVPGANDGASGTAVLLELAELLARRPPPIGVDLLFVDGEDYGPTAADMFLGSRHFAAHLPAGYRPRWALVLDLVADHEARFAIEAHSARAAPALVARLWALAAELGHGALFPPTAAAAQEEVEDDHLPLIAAGIPAALLIDLEYGPGNRYWHTPDDLPEHTSTATLQAVGEVVAALLYREPAAAAP